ncbi:MAG TPA: aminobutyraldehyde dehydrogenase [Solirubrobacteraceae bacterium]|nr:aminobutyraldehyde dehydrogenase [Solirubrobacteraceae bacterium]
MTTIDTTQTLRNVVDGAIVDSLADEVDVVLNPATEEPLAHAPRGTAQDVQRAVDAARRAGPAWRDTTPAQRAQALLRLADLLDGHAGELARLEALDVGKPLVAATDELPLCADHLRFFAGAARVLEGRAAGEYLTGYTSMVRREPLGVVGQITPWNYPLAMAIWKIAPALAAGNTVVLKPSELTPLSTLRLAELALEVLPAGVLNVVTGPGATGAAIAAHRQIRMVALTGSVSSGRAVAAAASATLARVHLELGGKAPVVVLDDADVPALVDAVRVAAFFNAGQDCTAATRIIATPGVHDEILERLVPAVQSLTLGDPVADEAVELGPVISAAHRERVLGHVERAAAAGAAIVCGGQSWGERGFFVAPTVIAGPAQDSEIVQREVFGPVVTIQRAADEAQALAWANDTDYGLAASIWSRDTGATMRAARELEFGCVWVNAHLPFLSEMPHGGFGQSGYGKDLSVYSLEEYTRLKHVMVSLA